MSSDDPSGNAGPTSGDPGFLKRLLRAFPSAQSLGRAGEKGWDAFRRLPPPLRLLTGLVIIFLVMAVPYFLGRASVSSGTGSAVPSGARGDDRDVVVALARLQPGDGILDVSAPGDDRVEEILVREGDWVTAGQVLARGRQYAVRQAEYDLLQTRLQETERRMASETAFRQTVVEQAELDLEVAELLEYEVAAREADVQNLAADSAAARDAAQRSQRLLQEGLTSQEAANATQREADRAAAALSEARARLTDTRGRTELDLRQATNRLEMSRAEAELSANTIPLESLRKELALAQAQLEGALVRAPVDARVLRIVVAPGENSRGLPILQLGETDRMYAVAEVYQSDIQLLQEGQRVELTSTALQGPLTGVVEDVGVVIQRNDIFGDAPNAPADARVFRVKIRLEDSELASRYTNLEVEARIFINPEAGT
ncbi:HlyD family efflux transporter periplasmic adaptor subunit [Gemmatimonadota bacterium]